MMKLGVLLFGVGLTLVLIAGCNDEPDTISCSITGTQHVGCSDGAASCNVTVCLSFEGTKSDCAGGGGTVVSSCSSDALLICEQSEGTVYYYDQAMVDVLTAENPDDPCAAGIVVNT